MNGEKLEARGIKLAEKWNKKNKKKNNFFKMKIKFEWK